MLYSACQAIKQRVRCFNSAVTARTSLSFGAWARLNEYRGVQRIGWALCHLDVVGALGWYTIGDGTDGLTQ